MNGNTNPVELKKGWTTSEFWVTVIATFIITLNKAFGWDIDPTALATVGGMVAAYVLSRMGTKKSVAMAVSDASKAGSPPITTTKI